MLLKCKVLRARCSCTTCWRPRLWAKDLPPLCLSVLPAPPLYLPPTPHPRTLLLQAERPGWHRNGSRRPLLLMPGQDSEPTGATGQVLSRTSAFPCDRPLGCRILLQVAPGCSREQHQKHSSRHPDPRPGLAARQSYSRCSLDARHQGNGGTERHQGRALPSGDSVRLALFFTFHSPTEVYPT